MLSDRNGERSQYRIAGSEAAAKKDKAVFVACAKCMGLFEAPKTAFSLVAAGVKITVAGMRLRIVLPLGLACHS